MMNVRTRRRAAALALVVGLVLLSVLSVLAQGTSDMDVRGTVACGPRPFLWDSVVGQRVMCDGSTGLWVEAGRP